MGILDSDGSVIFTGGVLECKTLLGHLQYCATALEAKTDLSIALVYGPKQANGGSFAGWVDSLTLGD